MQNANKLCQTANGIECRMRILFSAQIKLSQNQKTKSEFVFDEFSCRG